MVPWEIKMTEFINCNCAYGCPCQFNALPTNGACYAIGGFVVTEGHFGDTDLAGVKTVAMLHWPGAIHQGNGSVEAIVDESATPAQREAILKIMTGQETTPMATMFSVYASTMTTVHEPRFAPTDFEVDVENRTSRLHVPGLIEGKGEPIRNAVTGEPSRSRIDLPNGFEYEIAEMGSGTSRSMGSIKLELNESYGQFAHIHLNNHGPVRRAKAA